MNRRSVLKDKSFNFAIRCIKLYKFLIEEKKEFVMSKQILRSGTSVGANIREAQNAESKNDFIHKLAIAQKEADETIYWIELLKATEYINDVEYFSINSEAIQILKMLRSAILTSKSSKVNS